MGKGEICALRSGQGGDYSQGRKNERFPCRVKNEEKGGKNFSGEERVQSCRKRGGERGEEAAANREKAIKAIIPLGKTGPRCFAQRGETDPVSRHRRQREGRGGEKGIPISLAGEGEREKGDCFDMQRKGGNAPAEEEKKKKIPD